MSEARPSRISRFLSFVVGAFWYLTILWIFLVFCFWLAVMLGWKPTQGDVLYCIPISVKNIEFAEPPSSDTGKQLSLVKIMGYRDIVIADTLDRTNVSVTAILFVLPASTAIFLIFWQLRLFLRSVKEGRPFDRENPRRIRRIGYLVTVLGPLDSLMDLVLGWLYLPRISLPDSSLNVNPDLHPDLIFLGFIILLIAQIFDEGVKMQDEQDLTV